MSSTAQRRTAIMVQGLRIICTETSQGRGTPRPKGISIRWPGARFFSTQTQTLRNRVAYAGGNGIIHNVFRIPFSAEVAKSVDAVDSKSTIERCAGSIPAFGTIKRMNIEATERWFFCACISVFAMLSLFFTQPDPSASSVGIHVLLLFCPAPGRHAAR